MKNKYPAPLLLALTLVLFLSGGLVRAETFPVEPFNGMTLNYSISGVSIEKTEDLGGFTTSRYLTGTVTSGKVTVTASGVNPSTGYSLLTVRILTTEKTEEKTFESKKQGEAMKASASVTIPAGTPCQIVIYQDSLYGNGESRGLEIDGDFAASTSAAATAGGGSPSVPILIIAGTAGALGAGTLIVIRAIKAGTRKPNAKLKEKYKAPDSELKDAIKEKTNRTHDEANSWNKTNQVGEVLETGAVIIVATADTAVDGLSKCTGTPGIIIKVSYVYGKNIASTMAEKGITEDSLKAGFVRGSADLVNDYTQTKPEVKIAIKVISETYSTVTTDGLSATSIRDGLVKGILDGAADALKQKVIGNGKGYGMNILKPGALSSELSNHSVKDLGVTIIRVQGLRMPYSIGSRPLVDLIRKKFAKQVVQSAKEGLVTVISEAEVKPVVTNIFGINDRSPGMHTAIDNIISN